MDKGANISDCGRYRYGLWRTWDYSLPHVLFIGLNPSTADETEDDPTIRRCMGFARDWGYGGIYMANLFAWRSTDPKILDKMHTDPVGPGNDYWLETYSHNFRCIIACWGGRGKILDRDIQVCRLLSGYRLLALGLTLAGHPRQPLYLPRSAKPEPFRIARVEHP